MAFETVESEEGKLPRLMALPALVEATGDLGDAVAMPHGDDFAVRPAALADALGTIARSRGMSDIAKASGITREARYKARRPKASPRFETISKVCAALGVRLVAQPIHAHP